MKKIFLVAGFFLLTSTSQGFAKFIQPDTLPIKQPYFKLCDTDLRSAFFHWMQSQSNDSLVDTATIDLKSNTLVQRPYHSAFHFTWWPQAVRLNGRLNKIADLTKTSPTDYPLTGLAPGIYKWFGLHR